MSMSPVPQPATIIRSGRPDPAEWRCNSRPPKSLALSVGRSNDTAMVNALERCEGVLEELGAFDHWVIGMVGALR